MNFKKLIFAIIASAMALFTIISAVDAYPIMWPDLSPVNPSYLYYNGFENIPAMYGPYPRYYLGYNNYRGTDFDTFTHDDFNHFDEYIGYRDLDVFYPGRGYIDVLRNPSASIEPLSVPDQVYNFSKEYHVYGTLPGGAVYRKHYYHDHPWDAGEYVYGWFEPVLAYRNKPVFTSPCQSRSICQYTHCSC